LHAVAMIQDFTLRYIENVEFPSAATMKFSQKRWKWKLAEWRNGS